MVDWSFLYRKKHIAAETSEENALPRLLNIFDLIALGFYY